MNPDHSIADDMDRTWLEGLDERLAFGQETPHGFDLATTPVVPRTYIQFWYYRSTLTSRL